MMGLIFLMFNFNRNGQHVDIDKNNTNKSGNVTTKRSFSSKETNFSSDVTPVKAANGNTYLNKFNIKYLLTKQYIAELERLSSESKKNYIQYKKQMMEVVNTTNSNSHEKKTIYSNEEMKCEPVIIQAKEKNCISEKKVISSKNNINLCKKRLNSVTTAKKEKQRDAVKLRSHKV